MNQSRGLAFKCFAMPRGCRVRLAHVAAEADRAVPRRVRRFRDLPNQLAKLNAKDARTFEEDGVIHNMCTVTKKSSHVSRAEKEEV